MDASILTTFFCFILLVLNIVMFTKLMHLQALVEHHIDLTISEKEHNRTGLKILQSLEAQVHLMFNNAPPVPGEPVVTTGTWFTGQTDKRYNTEPTVVPQLEIILDKPKEPLIALARRKLKEHQIKAKPPVFPAKKRGRPRKAPKVNID